MTYLNSKGQNLRISSELYYFGICKIVFILVSIQSKVVLLYLKQNISKILFL